MADFPKDPNLIQWLRIAAYALFASVGGMLGYTMRMLEHGNPVRLPMAMMEGVASGFVGLLMYMLCHSVGLSSEWTGVIVGVSGWLGANATLRILEIVVYRKLGINKDDSESK